MNEIVCNNYDLVAFEQDGEVVVAVTFYRYYKKKAKGEVNYRWRTRCPELVDLLRSWEVEFDDDDEIYILYKKIIREVFFKMCNDMNIRF